MKSYQLRRAEDKATTHIIKLAGRKKNGLSKYLDGAVLILHEEGTTMFFNHAFAFEIETEYEGKKLQWRAIVPEHHEMVVLAADEASVLTFKSSETFPIHE